MLMCKVSRMAKNRLYTMPKVRCLVKKLVHIVHEIICFLKKLLTIDKKFDKIKLQLNCALS